MKNETKATLLRKPIRLKNYFKKKKLLLTDSITNRSVNEGAMLPYKETANIMIIITAEYLFV